MEGTGKPLPELGDHALPGQLGEAVVEVAVLELGHLYERRGSLDFGIDGTIEIVRDTGGGVRSPTGRQIGVQVKRGLSVARSTRYGRTLYCTEAHANYWLGHSLPIIVVHCDPRTSRLRWVRVTEKALRRTPKGYAVDIPEASDLRTSGEALALMTVAEPQEMQDRPSTVFLPFDVKMGILLPDDQLGLAALAVSRGALRGIAQRIELELVGEADLVAGIDSVRDTANPTAEAQREAIGLEDTLHAQRKRKRKVERALNLLLAEPRFADYFDYEEAELAAAIRKTAAPYQADDPVGETSLYGWYEGDLSFSFGFRVPDQVIETYYSRDAYNRYLIGAGRAGNVMILDLGRAMLTTRFFPALVHRIIEIADAKGITEAEVLAKYPIPFSFWLIGVA